MDPPNHREQGSVSRAVPRVRPFPQSSDTDPLWVKRNVLGMNDMSALPSGADISSVTGHVR